MTMLHIDPIMSSKVIVEFVGGRGNVIAITTIAIVISQNCQFMRVEKNFIAITAMISTFR